SGDRGVARSFRRQTREPADDRPIPARGFRKPLHTIGDHALFFRALIRVDDLARLVLRRIENDFDRRIAEGVDRIVFDVLELNGDRALLAPFAVDAKLDVADDSLEGSFADVGCQYIIIETLGRLDRLFENLKISVGPHRHVIAERIDALLWSPLLVFFQELHGAWKLHRF